MSSEVKKLQDKAFGGILKAQDIYDAMTSEQDKKEIIPIVTNVLRANPDDDELLESAIRFLGCRESAGTDAGSVLIGKYWEISPAKWLLRWSIGASLSVFVERELEEGILAIVADPFGGRARERFVVALARIGSERSDQRLLEILKGDDIELISHALEAARIRMLAAALPLVEKYSEHPNALIKKEARKTANRLRKSIL